MFKKLLGTSKCFPGAMPVAPSDIIFYDPRKWYFSNKLDGERFIAYNLTGKSELINRKCQVVDLPFELPKGSVFDIEIMDGIYFMLDYLSKPELFIMDRLRLGSDIIKKHSLPIKKKHFLCPNQKNLQRLIREQTKLGIHDPEGYIFIHKESPVAVGTTKSIFKHKKFSLCTVDFLYKDSKLYVLGKKGMEVIQIHKKALRNNSIVEMSPKILASGKIQWYFMRYREDKKKPNFITTYNSVVKTIKEYQELSNFMLK